MQKLIQILFGIFLFTFPFSVRFLVYEEASYRFGNFNPWVTEFIYLPEVLLAVIFVLWLIDKLRVKSYELRIGGWLWGLFLLFVLNAYVVTVWKGDPMMGAFFLLRAFEAAFVFWLIREKILSAKLMITILFFGALLQILWGYGQWKLNHSLGLTFLGESKIGPDVLGVAKIDGVEEAKQVRAYGSFLHPNILAAYILTIFFLGLRYLKDSNKFFWFAVFVFGIYITNSQAALIVMVAGLGYYFLLTVFRSATLRRFIALITLLVLGLANFWFFQNSHAVIKVRDVSWQERLDQNIVSRNMWQANPLGVGVSNYTLKMEETNAEKLLPWEFQPVHNSYLLILNEIGLQGLGLFILFLFVLFYRHWEAGKALGIFTLLLLASFDHFLWDSWAGIMLIALVAGFFALENHKEGAVEHVVDTVIHKDPEDES